MDMQTREIVTVLESKDNMNMPASVSPDGKFMLINKLKGMSDNRMHIVDMETGDSRDLYPEGSFAQYGSPAWKQDSSGFYFTTDEDDEFLYVGYYDVASKKVRHVYHTDHDVTKVALSSDGKYLAMVVSVDGFGEFRIMDTATGRFVAAPMPPRGFIYTYAGMQWSPKGHKLLFTFSSGSRPSGLWVLDLDGDAVYALTDAEVSADIKDQLAEPEAHSYTSFDGLRISYLFYKANDNPNNPP
jgi:dipeptidyl aminopeptidase/acylaminoacyl peptidase